MRPKKSTNIGDIVSNRLDDLDQRPERQIKNCLEELLRQRGQIIKIQEVEIAERSLIIRADALTKRYVMLHQHLILEKINECFKKSNPDYKSRFESIS